MMMQSNPSAVEMKNQKMIPRMINSRPTCHLPSLKAMRL